MNDERCTPLWFFNEVNYVFHFTIDLAASEKNALVSRYYTLERSGLDHPWTDEVAWCNPPYSRGQLRRWIKRAIEFSPVCTTVMLLPSDNSSIAGQLALRNAAAILFVNKRLAFDDEKSGAKFASWLAFFGRDRHLLSAFYALDYQKNLGVIL